MGKQSGFTLWPRHMVVSGLVSLPRTSARVGHHQLLLRSVWMRAMSRAIRGGRSRRLRAARRRPEHQDSCRQAGRCERPLPPRQLLAFDVPLTPSSLRAAQLPSWLGGLGQRCASADRHASHSSRHPCPRTCHTMAQLTASAEPQSTEHCTLKRF